MGTHHDLEKGVPIREVEIPPHKFVTTKQEWDRHMLDTLGNVRIWRRLVFLLSGLLFITSLGLVLVGLRPSEIPYIIEMNMDGSVQARGNVATQYENYVISEAVKEFQVRRFIGLIRTLGYDSAQVQNNWKEAIFISTQIVEKKLMDLADSDRPLDLIRTIRRSVTIDTVIHRTDTTIFAQWTESSWDKETGNFLSAKSYFGFFELVFLPPEGDLRGQQNLLSLYISGFDMKEGGGEE